MCAVDGIISIKVNLILECTAQVFGHNLNHHLKKQQQLLDLPV
jgi:hypothetical protein